ncbi:MAG: hypothetical protein NE328_01800 [Lentisphaeraceae bacterium]|nr:hypothetical protein [Lentisphaeraceae bacterium]
MKWSLLISNILAIVFSLMTLFFIVVLTYLYLGFSSAAYDPEFIFATIAQIAILLLEIPLLIIPVICGAIPSSTTSYLHQLHRGTEYLET